MLGYFQNLNIVVKNLKFIVIPLFIKTDSHRRGIESTKAWERFNGIVQLTS